jgi:hypothetical protein
MIALPREHHKEGPYIIWPVDGNTGTSALVKSRRHRDNARIPDISDISNVINR